jgi:hypothetical protein
MATTTPNYGWTVPTSSDLVKNGATAIETLGDSVDDSLWNSGFGQAGKNKIINGDFAINQRNFTTTTASGNGFIADRMFYDSDGTGTVTKTYSAFTVGSAPVAGYEAKNYATIETTGQSAATVYTYLVQNIEDVRTFAGQQVTFSFWAKAASGTPKISLENRQNFGSGGSTAVNTNFGVVTLTTSWARYSVTATVPSVSGKTIGAGSYSRFTMWVSAGTDYSARTNSIGIQSNTFDIWGVQAEYGAKMTPFQTASGGSPQAELAMCQRYYWRNTAGVTYGQYSLGSAYGTSAWTGLVPLPVSMRIAPTSIEYGNLKLADATNTPVAATIIISATQTSTNYLSVAATTGAGLLAQYRPYFLQNDNNTAGYIAANAEL